MFDELIQILNKMSALIESEDESFNNEERLQELYYEAKEALTNLYNYIFSRENVREQDETQYHKLEKQFKKLCQEFETPDDINEGSMNDMFPDGMDDGFDVDKFFDRD